MIPVANIVISERFRDEVRRYTNRPYFALLFALMGYYLPECVWKDALCCHMQLLIGGDTYTMNDCQV